LQLAACNLLLLKKMINKILYSPGKFTDFGLLVLRLGLGTMFILHAMPDLQAGPAKWELLGTAMFEIGVDFYPVMWGFAAALAQLAGGIMLIAGLLFRPACLVLLFVMFVAANLHVAQLQGFEAASHPIEIGIVLFSLLILGPGTLSIDNSLFADGDGDDDDDDDDDD